MIIYFAYGYNTNSQHMARRCPDAVCLGPARLLDHKFRFAYHADVVRARRNTVNGVLWRLTPQCLRNLDRFEGYPVYYKRKRLLAKQGTKFRKAIVYTMTRKGDINLPGSEYLTALLQGYQEHGVDNRQIYRAIEECENTRREYVSI